jgi:hypothetical protein
MTDIEVYTLSGTKHSIPSVSKVYEIIDYLKKFYGLRTISIISNGNILEEKTDITDIKLPLYVTISRLQVIAYSRFDVESVAIMIHIKDIKSNNILYKYKLNDDLFDIYDNILIYALYEKKNIYIFNIYDNVNIGTINYDKCLMYCHIIKEIPVKYIVCVFENNIIHIYDINNLIQPIIIYDFSDEERFYYNIVFSSTYTKIVYRRDKNVLINLHIKDLKSNSNSIITINKINVEYRESRYENRNDNETLSFSPDDSMLLAHFTKKILVYNISDGTIIYELNNEPWHYIHTIIWHPFESSLIFMNGKHYEENHEEDIDIDHENDINLPTCNRYNVMYIYNLYKCNIYDTNKEFYKLNNIIYKLKRSCESFESMLFSHDGTELIVPCYNSIVIHKIDDFNTIYKYIPGRNNKAKINY